eukprot:2545-Heterococcus_DN1.PRE.3
MPYTSLYVRAAATAAPLITAGTNFTAEGFKCVLEYLYTGAVTGVTTTDSSSSVDATKLRHTVQAARYFSMPKLKAAALQSAQAAGVAVEVARTEPDGDLAAVESDDNVCDESDYEYPSAASDDMDCDVTSM